MPPDHAWQSFLWYWVFLPNVLTDLVNWRFSWCWSLCVEEWFYLLLPVLVRDGASSRFGRRFAPERLLTRMIAGVLAGCSR